MTALNVDRSPAAETSELGCRSFFRIADDPAFLPKVHQQLYSWCKEKKWDADRLTGPGVVDLAPGVTASLVHEKRQDDSEIERYRFYQDEGHGVWITQLTTIVNRDGSGWVWTDVLQPSGAQAAVPRLAREILGVTDGLDGNHPLTAEPVRAGAADVDAIYAALIDKDRRGYLFLAGADDGSSIPVDEWNKLVKKLLQSTRGLASAYLLDGQATAELNARLPESHRISPWTIRTFLPEPDLADPRDAIRHRVLSTARIADDPAGRLRNILGRSACRYSTTIALPREFTRIDRRLRELLDETIVDQASATPTSTPEPAAEPLPADQQPATKDLATDPPAAGLTVKVADALRQALESVVDKAEVTAESVAHLGTLAAEALSLRRNVEALRDRLRTVQNERNDLDDLRTELQQRDQDSQDELAALRIEYSEAQKALRRADRENGHLRGELAKLDRGTVQWESAHQTETDPTENPPDSFQDLLDRISEFENIEFTGDPKPALDLDAHNSIDWAVRTWDLLRGLQDYCRLRSAGDFNGAIADYVSVCPPGCTQIPPGSHAPGETSQTEKHSKYGPLRILPVPTAVNAAGKLFMGEHLRIARYGMISPRMHIYNDATGTGKIYIGYIGPHLPNFRSS